MPNKVIPIITEGETDGCIVDAFEEAFYSERLSFTGVASGGDITLYKIHPENFRGLSGAGITGKVRTLIKQEIERRHEFRERDVIAVALLMDLDGAFIPDSQIFEGIELKYRADSIETNRVKEIRLRHREKKVRVSELVDNCSELKIGSKMVPFRAFYMSRNLEHALWDIADNLTGNAGKNRKRELSLAFIEKCESDPNYFKDLITSDAVLHGCSEYRNSWLWAFEGLHSLQRGSNVGLLPSELGFTWPDEC
ncbi:hypothetical protein [Bifidobacterium catenulatum]|nr:hypothetical protein [Bifidobacterium catenulatum]